MGWALALAGGVAVLAAAGLVLLDPCHSGGTCTPDSWRLASRLALGGTTSAIVGALAATVLTVRRLRTSAAPD